ncbi:hypothetical protein Tco_1280507 [Tanacetum coccineum]
MSFRIEAVKTLYHALMEALIEDENAIDNEVADTVKDHKRKHDGDDDNDDDDEGPPAGSNQAKDPVEEPTDKVIMDEQPTEDIPISDEGHVSDPEDTNNAHMPKVPDTTTWFRPIPEEERPASPEPEWVIPPIDLPEAAHSSDGIVLEGPAFMMVKGFHENNISLQFQMEECHKLLTNQIDLVNPEGHRIVPDISNPLPLGGPPGQLKAAYYQDFGLEELVPSLWIECEQVYDISAAYGIIHWWFSRKQFYINKHSEPSDRDAVRSHMRILKNDFKSLHPNDFEDLNILYIQGKLDHLPKQDKVNLHNAISLWTRNIVIRKRVEDLQLGVESYQTKLNQEQPN